MKRLKISPFLLLLVGSYMLIEGSFDPLWVLLFSLLHELGHMVAIRLLGGRLGGLSGNGQGFSLAVNGLSYRGELLAAAAGPLTSLFLSVVFILLGLILKTDRFGYFAFANAALAVLNLLPVLPLDGGRILRAVLAMRCSPPRQRLISRAVGLIVVFPLLAISFWQFLSSGYNLSLLFICIYLLSLIGVNEYDV